MNFTEPAPDTLLKRTTSRCPVCHAACPAEVWRTGSRPAKVFLKRTCAAHGEASVCIASDARFYWLAKGNPENENSCCGGGACCAADGSEAGTLGKNAKGRGDEPFETLARFPVALMLAKLLEYARGEAPEGKVTLQDSIYG